MGDGRQQAPAGAGVGGSSRLQRRDGTTTAPGTSQEDDPEDSHLDRLLGDRDVLLRLQLSGYAPEYWAPLASVFARYGLAVLRAWLASGRIFEELARRTGASVSRPAHLSQDDIESMATDTVMVSLTAFLEKVLKQNRWDPSKGASLKTFFIGQCVLQFRNVYRDWRRERLRQIPTASERDVLDGPGWDEPELAVLADEAARDVYGQLTTHQARQVHVLKEMGYTLAEIADQLGMPGQKSVQNVINYQRRLRRERIASRQQQKKEGA